MAHPHKGASAPTTGETLRAIWLRTGLSMRTAADRAGYQQASSIQRYIDGTYHRDTISLEAATKLADAFEGLGSPPIRRAEIMALTGNAQLLGAQLGRDDAEVVTLLRDILAELRTLNAKMEAR